MKVTGSADAAGSAIVTAGGVACYGTLEGYVKCVDANDITKELYKFKTPSGIIGNLNTWEHKGKQYVTVTSGAGGVWTLLGDERFAAVPAGGSVWTFAVR
mgnify:CR=1 FL=1